MSNIWVQGVQYKIPHTLVFTFSTNQTSCNLSTKLCWMWNQICRVSKLSVLNYVLCHSTVKPHQPVVTAESSQTGDPWPAGRVRGGKRWLPDNNPSAGEGSPVAAQPPGAYGVPGAPWLQLQQPGPLEERICLGRGQHQLEAAGRDGAENNTAFRCKVRRGHLENRLEVIRF